MKEIDTCETCMFHDRHSDNAVRLNNQSLAEFNRQQGRPPLPLLGLCRRYAPRFYDEAILRRSNWPVTSVQDWCGEWQLRMETT